MKIRSGFVSNSSSSSFVIACTIKVHEEALEKISPLAKEVLTCLGNRIETGFGTDLVVHEIWDFEGETPFQSMKLSEEGCAEDAFWEYCDIIPLDSQFTHKTWMH